MIATPVARRAGVPAPPRRLRRRFLAVIAAAALTTGACTTPAAPSPAPGASASASAVATSLPSPSDVPSPSPTAPPAGTITLYASVTQTTVDAVIASFARSAPGVTVDLFRAPTGEVTARIAAEIREGGIRADVLWLTDPLSIETYAAAGLLEAWEPANAAGLDAAHRGAGYWGTRLLNMVIVQGADVAPAPTGWDDLVDPAYRDAVAFPDPAFAGSAFAALAYFALTPEYGIDFFARLAANGATVVKTPDEVTTGVAEGQFKVGMTLDNSVRSAADKGSPVVLVWPDSGSIAISSPIAVVGGSDNAAAAQAFVEHVLSDDGQRAIGETGWQPVRPGLGGPEPGGDQVAPDWAAAFGTQQALLDQFRGLVGG